MLFSVQQMITLKVDLQVTMVATMAAVQATTKSPNASGVNGRILRLNSYKNSRLHSSATDTRTWQHERR